ncbi:hypothetical protein [Chamaesiphon sp.]|uniref:DUF7682 family zinc-binding protein n=1 Tax=Chamaesiphon sp. TaxID=2814140 RepID=UPI00359401AE
MSRRKKMFECGHHGYGQICHRCLQEEITDNPPQKQAIDRQQQSEKPSWRDSFTFDPIDLKSLPTHVILKARNIIDGLQERRDYREFRGKRLRHDRSVISIPVTRNYRLLCSDRDGLLEPKQVISHGDYNVCKPGS